MYYADHCNSLVHARKLVRYTNAARYDYKVHELSSEATTCDDMVTIASGQIAYHYWALMAGERFTPSRSIYRI